MIHRRTSCLLAALLLFACRQDMHDQPKYQPFEESDFFADGMASRPRVKGTVPRGHLELDDHLYRGLGTDGKPAAEFPFPIDAKDLARGRERFNIFCIVCHDARGTGNGMVVQRGFRRPESYHTDRLREAKVGYMFDVITNGFGSMPSHSDKIPVHDRWRIIAYVRALQLSRNASRDDVPDEEWKKLQSK